MNLPSIEVRRGRGRPRKGDAPEPGLVLEAALRAFARLGYEGVSLRAIGLEADVDSSLIVRRFDGKLGLWRAVVDHVSENLKQVDAYDATADLPLAVVLERAIARSVQRQSPADTVPMLSKERGIRRSTWRLFGT